MRAETRARRRAALLALAAGLLLLAGLSALLLLDPGIRASRDPARTLLGLGAAVAGAAVLLTARLRTAPLSPRAGGLLAALALLPLPWLAGEPLASVPAAAVRAEHSLLSAVPRGPEAGRVFAPAGQDRSLALRWRYGDSPAWSEASVARAGAALAGYTNLFHGVATTGSASPLGSPRPERLVGTALAGGDAGNILALVNVRHIVSPFPPRIPGLTLSGEKGGVRLYQAPGAFGRSYFPARNRIASDDEAYEELRRPGFDPGRVALIAPPPPGTSLPPPRPAGAWAAARFVADEPERAELTTSASVASLLVLTRSWDPGWEARVDGERVPVLRAQLALVAVVVPPGEHRIEIAYRPRSFRIGLALSGAGLLALLALALAAPPGALRR